MQDERERLERLRKKKEYQTNLLSVANIFEDDLKLNIKRALADQVSNEYESDNEALPEIKSPRSETNYQLALGENVFIESKKFDKTQESSIRSFSL
jgi:hypothetical protein